LVSDFDLSKGFTQKQSTDDSAFRTYDSNRISYLKEYNATIKAKKANALVILEHFAEALEEKELGDAGMMVWHKLNNEYCQSAMGYQEGSDFSNNYYWSSAYPAHIQVSYMERPRRRAGRHINRNCLGEWKF